MDTEQQCQCQHKFQSLYQFAIPFNGRFRVLFCTECRCQKECPIRVPKNYRKRRFGDAPMLPPAAVQPEGDLTWAR